MLPVGEIGAVLGASSCAGGVPTRLLQPARPRARAAAGGASRRRATAFEALLEFLKRTRGLDFTGYKRASLERRFRRRMDAVGCPSYGDYLDYLEVHPDEYEQLFEMLLINVTEFFRDPPAWDDLREDVPAARCSSAKPADEPIRVWSAGCAQRAGGLHGRDGAGRGARRRRATASG